MARKPAPAASNTKLFVLDTNVLMHDPTSLFRFEEHDVYVPMMTLEELDNNKKGMSEIARNARQVTRTLDDLVSHGGSHIEQGIPLGEPSKGLATGRLYLQTEAINTPLPPSLPSSKYDNQILGVILFLQLKYPGRDVILVSKDINMRIKARALGLLSEVHGSCRVTSGRPTAPAWSPGKKTPKPATVLPDRCVAIFCSMNLFTT